MNKKIEIIENEGLIELRVQTTKIEHTFLILEKEVAKELADSLIEHFKNPKIVESFIIDDDGLC
jgi:hypothetical protein